MTQIDLTTLYMTRRAGKEASLPPVQARASLYSPATETAASHLSRSTTEVYTPAEGAEDAFQPHQKMKNL